MKIIREAKYIQEKCKHCGHISRNEYQPAIVGCDNCSKILPDKDGVILETTVFLNNETHAKNYHYCSWKCVLEHLKKLKSDYFIKLPFLYFDNDKSGKEFIKIIKGQGR